MNKKLKKTKNKKQNRSISHSMQAGCRSENMLYAVYNLAKETMMNPVFTQFYTGDGT